MFGKFGDLSANLEIVLIVNDIYFAGSFNHVSLRLVRRVFNHTLRFMDGYRLALDGPLLDFAMKKLVGKRRVPIDMIPTIREDFDKHMRRKLTKTT